MEPLDHPIWSALKGPQSVFADVRGAARRFLPEIGFFAGMEQESDSAYADLRDLFGPEGGGVLFTPEAITPGAGLQVARTFPILQMVLEAPAEPTELEMRELGPVDLPEMLDLVRRTEPGPFGPRTPELGRYLGVRDGGRLVAMAGERLRLPGAVEVSAVCTDPDFRGRGLARALVAAVAGGIQAAGHRAFLHVFPGNAGAIRVYEALGFRARRTLVGTVLRAEG